MSKQITYNGETHTFAEWCRILQGVATDDDLRGFAENLEFYGKISNETLYQLYMIWADGHCLPKSSFEKLIPKTFQKYRPDIVKYRSGSVRGWKIDDGFRVCDSNLKP